MPRREIEPDDPMELVGVVLPGSEEATREMACVFAEEFARMGYGREAILAVFRNAYYRGPHSAYRELGEERVRAIVDECVGAWAGSGPELSATRNEPPAQSKLKGGSFEPGDERQRSGEHGEGS